VEITRPDNPYEFKSNTPEIVEVKRQTNITDFMRKHESSPASFSSPRMGHFKNARSVGSAGDTAETLRPIAYGTRKSSRLRLQRSGSSPQIGTMRFAGRGDEESSPELPSFADEYGYCNTPARQGRGKVVTAGPQRGRQYLKEYSSPACYDSPNHCRQDNNDSSSTSPSYTSFPMRSLNYNQEATPANPPYDRYYTQPPTKTKQDIYKRDSVGIVRSIDKSRFSNEIPSPCPSPPKRSRSPMKKLFGDQGWFGERLPDGADLRRMEPRRSTRSRATTNSSDQMKKTGMMERIKNKFGEFVS
jgi:hypothetical protein